jgi:carboxypeptidase PM20D1
MLGASDSRHFCAICDQVLRFSPLKMSKEELRSIHGINEKISFDQLSGVIAFYYNLVRGS